MYKIQQLRKPCSKKNIHKTQKKGAVIDAFSFPYAMTMVT